jgi:hypothetical protein
MPKPPPDPLAGTDRLLVDGTNLLHAMRRGQPAAPAATLIGRLRGAIPPHAGIELVLDGPPDRGMHNTRIAAGLIVRYSGRRSADELLLALVEDVRRAAPASTGGTRGADRRAAVDNLLVVTDDHELRLALQARGVRTAGTRWLMGRLDRAGTASPSVGNRRPPRASGQPGSGQPGSGQPGDDADRPGWQPGRGATTKRGNPRRGRPSHTGGNPDNRGEGR